MGIAAYNRGTQVIRRNIESPVDIRSLSGSVNHPIAEYQPMQKKPEPFEVGEIVYCRVTALRGQRNTITEVNGNRIKIIGYRTWCPAHNFQREPN